MTATAAPLVPIVSFLNHWDHHWYVWLPGDPVYEAVEVMANERGPQEPLVWVFFTERAQPKHQLNYYNDQAAVAVSKARGGDAHLAAMRFAMSGGEGARRAASPSRSRTKMATQLQSTSGWTPKRNSRPEAAA